MAAVAHMADRIQYSYVWNMVLLNLDGVLVEDASMIHALLTNSIACLPVRNACPDRICSANWNCLHCFCQQSHAESEAYNES